MSPPRLDLKDLAVRESEQVEWMENVADYTNLGGGYVVCGAR